MASHALNIQISLESNKDFGAFCFHVHPHKRSIQPKGLPLWIQPPTKQIMRMLKTSIKMAGTSKVTMAPSNPLATPRIRGSVWMARRARWLSGSPLCVMCEAEGRVTEAKEVDHIIRLEIGGADDESNYQSLCVDHHKAKTASEVKRSGGRW